MKTEQEKLKIIKENQNLIYKIASRYSGYYSMDDLFQEGVKGVIKAIENYRDNCGTKFSTYAYDYILGEIIRFINNDRTIRVNSDLLKIYKSYEKSKDCLTGKLGRVPSFYEICSFMDVNPNVVAEAIQKCEFAVSLDGIINEDDFTLEKVVGNDTREVVDDHIDLQSELDKLSERDRKIIELRYYRDYTQSETARILGMNQVQVSRYEGQILKKMKNNIAA